MIIRAAANLAMVVLVTSLGASTTCAQGIVIPGVGPINRAMAGAAVAAPIDAAGAIHWNPASISFLEKNEVSFGAEFTYPRTKLTSVLPADAFGPGAPPITLAGTNHSNSGIGLLPTTAMVYHQKDSDWSFGLGLFAIGGVGVNYHASATNPILTPQPPAGFGGGAVFSRFTILQFAPTASVRLTDGISIGVAPTINVADLGVDPATYAVPDDANGDGFRTYPNGTHARLHWGLGFQVGIYCETDSCWSFGASLKSPVWFERFESNSQDELGQPRTLKLQAEFPMIISIGTAYRGFDRTVMAVDLRFTDFENADFLGDRPGFGPDRELTGLGWSSVFSVAAGVQHELNEQLTVRLGYLFTQNPIPGSTTTFNIPATAIYQHAIFLGTSHKLTDQISLSLAYYHAFRNSITGPYQTPLGPLAGSRVHVSQEIDGLVGGLNVYF